MKKQIFKLEMNRNNVGLLCEGYVPSIDCASAWFEEDTEVSVSDFTSVDRAFDTLFSEE